MPLDHYVSQVHLRNFYSPALDGTRMFGFRKRDGHIFPCRSRDVCRVENGSTNEYLLHDRAIEEFLKTIEPNYNRAIVEFRSGNPSRDAVYAIAGFVSYVSSCSPAAMRLGSDPLRTSVEATAKILDSRGLIPRAPQALGGKTMTELLTDGDVQVTIDGKYPQAIGISAIMDRVGILGNSTWDVIISDSGQSPFFTSDFPTAIERSDDPRILNRIAPLAPDLVVRIRPDLAVKELRGDFSFPKFRFRTISPKNSETRLINQTIVRCAEQLVFFRDQADWVAPFLNRNRTFQIQSETIQIPVERGFMNVSTMRTRRAQSA